MNDLLIDPGIGIYFFLIAGLAMGSFGNVVIDRLPRGESLGGRSHCENCNKPLTIFELVPVFSWLMLKGRCSKCKARIPARLTIVEAGMSAVFIAAIFWTDFRFFPGIALALALWTMTVIAMIDARTKLIPDALTFVLGLSAIAYRWMDQSLTVWPVAICLGFFALQWIISRGKWVGSGDVFLAGALGLWLPTWQHAVIMLMASYITGAIIAVVLLSRGEIARKAHVPFGPFLIAGAAIAFFGGDYLLGLLFPYA